MTAPARVKSPSLVEEEGGEGEEVEAAEISSLVVVGRVVGLRRDLRRGMSLVFTEKLLPQYLYFYNICK